MSKLRDSFKDSETLGRMRSGSLGLAMTIPRIASISLFHSSHIFDTDSLTRTDRSLFKKIFFGWGGQQLQPIMNRYDLCPFEAKGKFGTMFWAKPREGEGGWDYVCKKQSKDRHEGCHSFALREISILKFMKDKWKKCTALCHMHDAWIDGEHVYIVFKREFTDLESFLSRAAWKKKSAVHGFQAAVRILVQLAVAIEFFHMRFVHRDIKPANVLIDEAGKRIQITDFGCARECFITNDEKLLTLCTGSPAYKPPEILDLQMNKDKTEARYDGKAWDIWSIGCIWWEMVYGFCFHSIYKSFIFDYEHYDDRILKWINKYNYMHVDPHCETITLALLAHQPSERPDAKQLRTSLVKVFG